MRHELVFVDPSRDTPELDDLPGAPERVLETVVWVGPATGAEAVERPLLLLAHGYDGDPDKLEALASDLAEAGLLVAAIRFPASHYGSGAGPLGATDLAEQPADLSFVLDGLIAAHDDPDHVLHRRFDADRVSVLGHSLGGATVLGWTRFDGADPRVDASVLVSPAEPLTVIFGDEPSPAGPPTLLIHGTDDDTLTPEISVDLYEALDPPAALLLVSGAGHSDLLESQEEPPIPVRQATQDAVLGFVGQVVGRRPGAWSVAADLLASEGHEVDSAL